MITSFDIFVCVTLGFCIVWLIVLTADFLKTDKRTRDSLDLCYDDIAKFKKRISFIVRRTIDKNDKN